MGLKAVKKKHIEEGEVIEKQPRKKWLAVSFVFALLIIIFIYFFINNELTRNFNDSSSKNIKDSSNMSESPIYSYSDYENDIEQMYKSIERLTEENNSLKDNLNFLIKKIEEKSLMPNKSEDIQYPLTALGQVNTILTDSISELKAEMKSKKNFQNLGYDFKNIFLIIKLADFDIDNNILSRLKNFEVSVEQELIFLINRIDTLLLSLSKILWAEVDNKINLPVNRPGLVDSPAKSEFQQTSSFMNTIKQELMKFIEIEPIDNLNDSFTFDPVVLSSAVEIDIKIAMSRIHLSQLDFEKLSASLKILEKALERNFPEIDQSKNLVKKCLNTLSEFRLDYELLDEIVTIIETEKMRR